MERIKRFLDERKENGLLRELKPASLRKNGKIYINNREYIDFSSNDYLGLSNHPRIKKAVQEAVDKFGASSSASRLMSGDLEGHHKLEESIAIFKGKESALVFNSGYQANVGIINALCKKEDVIFSDRLNHASIIDGIILSGARFFRYQHLDMGHLKALLKKKRHSGKEAFIITETVFSMDGDVAPLDEIIGLKERYNCMVVADDAHATGVFEEKAINNRVDFLIGTFGKALGCFGAYLACSKDIRDYLINTCRSFIYSTALPSSIIAGNLVAVELVREEPFRGKELLENAEYFRSGLKEKGFQVKGCSQIVPLIAGNNEKAVRMSNRLQEKMYWALPIRQPTVPKDEARIRFSLSYSHTKDILDRVIRDIEQA